MKRIIILCLLLALFVACVPTPEDEIVVGKNTQTMLAAAESDASAEETNVHKMQVPDRYQCELLSAGGNVTVSVDATIFVPDGPLPIVRVLPRDFTEADAQNFISVLLGSDPYYYDGVYPKSYWRERLDAAIDAIDHWDEGGMNYFNEYDTPEEAREGLEKLNRYLNEAPDEPVRVEPDFSFETVRAYNSEGPIETTDNYMSVPFVDPSQSFGQFHIMNAREISGIADLEYFRDAEKTNPNFFDALSDVTKVLKITQSEAEAKAKAVADALGMTDFVLSKSYGANAYFNGPNDYAPVWTCILTRTFGAAPTTYTSNNAGSMFNTDLLSETLYIDIDDTGVYYLRYEGPLDILETVNADAKLLPFSEIQSIFERMVVLKDNKADHPEEGEVSHSDRYVISEVRLGLALVREQDKDTALLVPAWDFLGYLESTYPGNTFTSYYDRCHSFLTINAIDGSIIDRSLGY